MCDYDLVRHLLAPALAGRDVLDPAVQADLARNHVMGVRSRVKYECTTEGVHITGGAHPRTIRWEDLDQLTNFDEIEDSTETEVEPC